MVIQRWQSVLLFCAAALMACFTFFSLGQVQTPDYSFNFTSLGFTYEGIATDGSPTGYLLHTWYFFCVSLMSVILPLVAIFCFRNERLQTRLCLVSVLFIIACMAVAGCLGYTAVDNGSIGWSTNIISPFAALAAVILAYGRIRSDWRKLRSADRIR